MYLEVVSPFFLVKTKPGPRKIPENPERTKLDVAGFARRLVPVDPDRGRGYQKPFVANARQVALEDGRGCLYLRDAMLELVHILLLELLYPCNNYVACTDFLYHTVGVGQPIYLFYDNLHLFRRLRINRQLGEIFDPFLHHRLPFPEESAKYRHIREVLSHLLKAFTNYHGLWRDFSVMLQ